MLKKNKILTYVLIVVMLMVWGMIIYRIVIAYSSGGDEAYIAPPPIKEVFNDYAIPRDTSRLLLNYRDPFGLAAKKDTIKPSLRVQPRAVTKMANPVISFNWGVVRYSGYIKNPGSKKLVAFMHINGKAAEMDEGETVDQIKLLKNLKDSVLVKHEGKTKYIHIQPAI
ncbi:hypothetical protein [Mucilaginibacter flavus]|uniref:hypothetical protein n=1 Tax=Mucilaginibacter flavus TaxID=931504 RepID=UPI0025B3B5FF|nr:hypothetical protein [Mucilaginibacter flavus]MDN3580783.1 hypothetical protein [Mucilaginibacter flavus]